MIQLKYILVAATITSMLGFLGCSDDSDNPTTTEDPGESTTELLSKVVTAAPAIDGVMEDAWKQCKRLKFDLVVPEPGGNSPITGGSYFRGYVNDKYTMTLRSMYDDKNIYFLAQWDDKNVSYNRNPWYFDPSTKTWKQESRAYTFDAQGNKIRPGFYEDKLAMLWNANESVPGFNESGCYQTCHTGLDVSSHFGAPALHYTDAPGQIVDMWHWKSVRTPGQVDDQYIDNDEFGHTGTTPEGGRKSDPKTAGGYTDNRQRLKVSGKTDSVNVPKYFIPGKTNYYYVLQTEIDAGTAKLITGVDENGVLTYDGGTIDPNTDTGYQRNGDGTGAKAIPSVYVNPPIIGDRGDITAGWVFTNGTGWTLEWKRALTTNSQYDVQFTPAKDYVFGTAVFDNAAIAHAIKARLTLKFAK